MKAVAVVKTRSMIAVEVADAVGAQPWERDVLLRLRQTTLQRIASRLLPDFSPVDYED